MPEDTRRRFLKRAGITGLVGGLAGCSGQQSQDTPTPRVETVVKEKTVEVTPEEGVEYEPLPTYKYIQFTRGYHAQLHEEAVLYQQALKNLGFELDIEVLEISAYVDKLLEREWDFTNLLWSGSPENLNPLSNFKRSFTKQFIGPGEPNYSHWAHPEWETAVQRFEEATQDEELEQDLADWLQECLAVNQVLVWTLHPDVLSAANTETWTNWTALPGTMAFSNRPTFKNLEGSGDAVVWGQITSEDAFPTPMQVTNQQDQYLGFFHMDHIVDYNSEGEIVPAAAETWEFVEENVLRVKLREDMTFHDGEDVTAEDLVFSYNYINEHGVASWSSDYAVLDHAEQVDEYTADIVLESPSTAFVGGAGYLLYILPKHIWEGVVEEEDLSHPREWTDDRASIGSGPFELVEYDRQNRAIFEKHEDHYNADQFPMDQVVFKVYGTNATLISDVGRGNASFAQSLGANDYNRAQGMDTVQTTRSDGIETHGIWINGINNHPDPEYHSGEDNVPFNDVYVRQALAHAVSRQEVIDTVWQGYAAKATNYVQPAAPFYNADVPEFPFNLSKARELLLESGLRYDESGQLLKPVDWEPRETYISPGPVPGE